MSNRLIHYAQLMRLHRPIGILLTLWPSLWALWIANHGNPGFKLLFIFIAGAIIVRSAGCVINDIIDRKFDSHVERTRSRPLASNKVNVNEAIILFCVLGILGFILVLFLNLLSVVVAIIAASVTVLYPFAKRFTYFPQIILGIVFNSGIILAFTASINQLPAIAWVVYAATILWTVAYDTEYAMADRADDVTIGIKSTAILFGQFDRFCIAILQVSMLLLLIIVGLALQFSIYYLISLVLVLFIDIYQHYLIKDRNRTQCFNAFLNNHWIGLVIFIGILASV